MHVHAQDLLNQRKGSMLEMGSPTKEGLVTVQYEVPSRGMNGVKSKLLSATRVRIYIVYVIERITDERTIEDKKLIVAAPHA